MPQSTPRVHDRVAVVFDFDETLGGDSYDTLVEALGEDPEAFEAERIAPLTDAGWDKTLARVKALVDLSDAQGGSITEQTFDALGRETPLFDGVEGMFDRVRAVVEETAPGAEVEFVCLTAGFGEVPSASAIADEFTHVWGGACAWDADGALCFAKRLVTHPEKVRYLLALAKGIDVESGADGPADVYRDLHPDAWHVPFDQMVYVGDGSSDLSAFDLVDDRGGLAIGVVPPGTDVEGWNADRRVHSDRWVSNLAPADYSEGSELMRSLELAARAAAARLALRRLGDGE